MKIEFSNLSRVCKLRTSFINYNTNQVEKVCEHTENKTYECNETKCPINNTNYWSDVSNITIYSNTGDKIELGNGKMHINKVR